MSPLVLPVGDAYAQPPCFSPARFNPGACLSVPVEHPARDR